MPAGLFESRRSFLVSLVRVLPDWTSCLPSSGTDAVSHGLALGSFVCQPSSLKSVDMLGSWHLPFQLLNNRKAKRGLLARFEAVLIAPTEQASRTPHGLARG